ncbi:hypothetical protein [Streptomyces sp. NPDC056154]|uniref:hypothetical protein n=1 Tax=unclassified Streptomyces TaxID=2593676 RepID=UPI0035DA434D
MPLAHNPRAAPHGHTGAPPWLRQLRERRQSVRAADFTRARQLVDRSDIIPLLPQAQRRARKSHAGRTRTVSLEALFIAMTLDSWRNQGRVVLAEAADILAQQLTPAARAQLALPAWSDDTDGFESAYLAVRRTFHAAEAVMDPSPLPKHRPPRAEALRLEREADQEQLAARPPPTPRTARTHLALCEPAEGQTHIRHNKRAGHSDKVSL